MKILGKKPHPGIKRTALRRGFSVSMAGARAGGAVALDTALGRVLPLWKKHSKVMESEARRFALELGRLKGTYVKVGQM